MTATQSLLLNYDPPNLRQPLSIQLSPQQILCALELVYFHCNLGTVTNTRWRMKLPFKQSPWLRVKDGYFRMFVRWLYSKALNELYIPRGTVASIKSPDNGRVPPRPNQGLITIRAKGRGNQEAYFFEEFEYTS